MSFSIYFSLVKNRGLAPLLLLFGKSKFTTLSLYEIFHSLVTGFNFFLTKEFCLQGFPATADGWISLILYKLLLVFLPMNGKPCGLLVSHDGHV